MAIEVASQWVEDGSATVYARLTARDATGVSISGEGKCLKKADISSITFLTYDEDAPTVTINSGTVVVNNCIFDTLQTSLDDPVWRFNKGFNFRHDLGPTNFPEGDKVYVVEYKITTTGGTVGYAIFRGKTVAVQ